MTTNFVSPKINPLLNGVERVSPALALDLVVGYDSDNWPVFRCYRVGDVVLSTHDGAAFRIMGFTLDDELLLKPHGLGHHPSVRLVTGQAVGFDFPTSADGLVSHKDGLVFMG